MPLESGIKRRAIERLKRIPHGKVIDQHRSGYGERGIPDTQFLVLGIGNRCYPFFFEFKRDMTEETEKLQKLQIERLRATGATAEVVRDWAHIVKLLWPVLTAKQKAMIATPAIEV